MIEKLPVELFLQTSVDNFIIDVRSPLEYNHAHIPGAASIPLFTDEERKIIGTAYKQQSKEVAIKMGLDFFGAKMKRIVEEVEDLVRSRQLGVQNKNTFSSNSELQAQNCILLYCWRGGMRSAAVAWLLNFYGFTVKVLAEGYKAYRNYVLQTFNLPFLFKVIGGFTGSGKTELLEELKKAGELTINLEELACHKGSAFGKINMPPQPTQEMFENLLSHELQAANCKKEKTHSPLRGLGDIWIEDESQRIGQLNIPTPLWQTLRQSPVYFLNISFEERLQHLVEEYGSHDTSSITEAISRISKQLGRLEAKQAINFFLEGNIAACFGILLNYYDKRYLKALHNRDNVSALLTTINCTKVDSKNADLLLNTPVLA
ncbi:MAG: tRNA 2-selenouridine(34) synthase MnmH [Chitinophagaceae bacterium]